MKKTLLIIVVLFFVAPGCYWPSSVEIEYKEKVAVNCVLVAGRPLDSLWITKTIGMGESFDTTKANVDTLKTVIIVFEGSNIDNSNMVDTLEPVKFSGLYPHDCYKGHMPIEANTVYSLKAEIVLVNGNSYTLRARTRVPDQIKIDSVMVPLPARSKEMKKVMVNSFLMEFVIDPDKYFIRAYDNDTLNYIPGMNNITVNKYKFYPNLPVKNAQGISLIHSWSDSLLIIDTIGFKRYGLDTINYPKSNKERIMMLPMDTLFRSLVFVNKMIRFAGKNTFEIYALDSAAYKYESYLNLPEPYTNVEGGYGYFGSSSVDTISFFIKTDIWTITLTDSLKSVLDSIKIVRDSIRRAARG